MARLKGVIFGVENVLIRKGRAEWDQGVLAETGRLVGFLKKRGVEAAVISNRNWTVTDDGDDRRYPLKDFLEEQWGTRLHWFTGGVDVNFKQRGDALEGLFAKLRWQPNEAFFVGNSDIDMQSAIHGKVLLLNATWYEKQIDYGFPFDRPKEVARFIDVFCRRDHHWFFRLEDQGVRAYALAPYSTMINSYKDYSEYFYSAIKNRQGRGHDFWAKYLCTSMYFSGLYRDIDYICPYPGHRVNSFPSVLQGPMDIFAKCFNKRYLRDLVVRHTDALESKKNRATVGHLNQLNTIQLTRLPLKNATERYKNPPLKAGKTVLVVDDIMTEGYSFEAARLFIRQTGADVICVSLLKTINRDYHALVGGRLTGSPYDRWTFQGTREVRRYGYQQHVVDHQAPHELDAKLDEYRNWDWPED